jgi:hypothetical protein
MRLRGELGPALVVATVAHVGLLAVAPRVLGGVRPSVALSSSDLRSATIDVEVAPERRVAPEAPPPRAPEPPPPVEPPARAEPPAPPANPAPAAHAVKPAIAPPSSERPGPPEPQAPAPVAPPSQPAPPGPPVDDYGAPPAAPVVGLPPGLGGRPAWSVPGVMPDAPSGPPGKAAATASPEQRKANPDAGGQAIRSSLQTQDKQLGLDQPAAGVVAASLEAAVRSSDAPPEARATFEVKLGADGKVLGVTVKSSSAGNGATWDRVARNAAGALSAKSLALRGDAAERGATVTVKIESRQVYPAGTKKKADVQPVCAEEVMAELAKQLAAPIVGGEAPRGPYENGAVNRADPAAALGAMDEEQRRKFCLAVGVRGKGDMSNFGAHAQTQVSSSYKVAVPGMMALPVAVKPIDTRVPWAPVDPNKEKLPQKKWKPKKKK